MSASTVVIFPPFCVDLTNEQLWHDTEVVPLRPKTFAVLRYLVEHPGRLVPKEELITAVWPDTVGSDEAPKRCIRELRDALGDEVGTPRFIETMGRRGYRWIATVAASATPVQSPMLKIQSATRSATSGLEPEAQRSTQPETWSLKRETSLVGRETELTRLHQLLSVAVTGARQLVFVTGEPGIGKTALIDAFVAQLPTTEIWCARGQCVAQHGPGEPYLPLLEALGRLGRLDSSARLLPLLRQYAPSWLVQLPALIPEVERETMQRALQGVTRERMLRELAEALEVLTTALPLVLVLEDLHWSDVATLDWLTAIAQRRDPARLLIVGTYRPVDVIVQHHPLRDVKQELQQRGQCQELALAGLTVDTVTAYLNVRFPAHKFPASIARLLHDRTEGNPLFLVAVLDEWVARGVLQQKEGQWHIHNAVDEAMATVPTTIAQMIERQVARLSPQEQHLLEAASIVGVRFATAAVAAACSMEPLAVEACCVQLARGAQVITEQGVIAWPDGTVASSFQFVHALHREAMYQRVPLGQRVQLHQRIGEHLERAYGDHAAEIAAELAIHFEEGHDLRRAVQYLQQAAATALQRHAYDEVLTLTSRALGLVQTEPDPQTQAQQELALHFCRLQAILTTRGHASYDAQIAYEQLHERCQAVGTPVQLFSVLMGFGRLHHGHGEYRKALTLGKQCLAIAQREQAAILLGGAYYIIGVSELLLGNLLSAHEALNQGLLYYDKSHNALYTTLYGSNPYISCRCYAALSLWLLGYPQQAIEHANETRADAQELAHPYTSASALGLTPFVYSCCRRGGDVQSQAEESLAMAARMEFPFWVAISTFLRGWGIAEQGHFAEGIQLMQNGLSAQQHTGSSVHGVHFAILLAEAHSCAGQADDALHLLATTEALMEKTGERMYAAELYRIKGESLLLQEGKKQRPTSKKQRSTISSPQPLSHSSQVKMEAEACFRKAIDIARQQHAKSFELRAVMSLVRLRQQQALGQSAEGKEVRAGSREQGVKNETAGKREGVEARMPELRPSLPASQRSSYGLPKQEARTRLAEVHKMLSEVYNWFTEGFDTKDLQEAKALLNALP